MRFGRAGAVVLAGLACVFGCAPAGDTEDAEPPADVAFVGGVVYTADGRGSLAEAVAVREGRIVVVGSDDDVRALTGADTRIVDLAGGMLLPGFHDAHIHPVLAGLDSLECSLSGLPDVDAILDAVRACVESGRRRGDWVVGGAWNVAVFPRGNANKRLLDAISTEVPIALTDENGHAVWVNSAALARAGVDRDTQAPEAGVIERDETGEPSGTLRESAAHLIYRAIPEPSDAKLVEAAGVAVRALHRVGVTAVMDAAVGEPVLRAYAALADRGELGVRVVACIEYGTGPGADRGVADALIARRGEYRRDRLDPDCVKLFVDGVLEGETAALLEPYVGREGYRGEPTFAPDDLNALVTRFDAAGLRVHQHAIGTAGVRMALDAVAAARAANGPRDARHTIAHLQLIHPDDIPRFAALDVVANFQIVWAYPDEYVTRLNLPVIGPERLRWMYPVGSVHRAGGRLALGTDWNVTPPDALPGIEVGLTRSDPTGAIEGVLNPEQALDLPTLLDAYTRGSAFVMGLDGETGSIEVGRAADLVVLERNLLDVPKDEIAEVRVLETWVGGRQVYAADTDGLRPRE